MLVFLFKNVVYLIFTYFRFSQKKKSFNQCNTEKGKLKFMLELKATKTSLALIGVYVFCWGPLGIYMMINIFCDDCLVMSEKNHESITKVLTYLCFSSNLLAPLCYCWASKEYRKAGRRICQRVGFLRQGSVFSVSSWSRRGTENGMIHAESQPCRHA